MTDFYAYFEIPATVTDRVGGVSVEAARGTTTDPFELLQRVKQPHGAYPRVSGVAVELVDVIPHFQAEEFAKHAFMHRPELKAHPYCTAPPEPAPRPSGLQYLWEVDTDLAVRFAHIVSAPTRELAAERAAEVRAQAEARGFAGLDAEDAAFAKAEVEDTRRWIPDGIAMHAVEVAQ